MKQDLHSPDRWLLVWFGVLSYAISWSIWLLPVGAADRGLTLRISSFTVAIPWKVLTLALGNFGPGLAAIVLTYCFGGRADVFEMLRKLVPYRANMKWFLLAALSPAIITALTLSLLEAVHFGGQDTVHWVRVFIMNLFLAPLWEEVGWRGYLLRNLQFRRNGLFSSLVVGLVWGVWHVPLYWGARLGFIECFALYIVALSVIFTWFYNKTRGNLAVVVVLHAAVNASTISLLGPTMTLLGIGPFLEITALTFIVAIGIIVSAGMDLSRNRGDNVERRIQNHQD